ncbi:MULTISPECIES: chaplin [unclassified Streptomyces]|uniref:chaplin n=1 Tax=unclassified Streptomyces TaxID=2593676 RepID=UPI000823A806|nr:MULTISPECIES: chaplin [unclassified Streptomyces]MYT96986.1 DUF320 domain-containing protein [Streptomyces sp. SID8350]SCK63333.1 Small secreted domain [Streptomyces sp. AmelKG-D3]
MSRIAKGAVVALGTGALAFGGAGLALADAGAQGAAVGSPGILSGGIAQVPVNVPVNFCGNTINVAGLLNPSFGNTCVNGSVPSKGHPDPGYGDSGYDHSDTDSDYGYGG